ncbi:Bifunctional xylanase/deacetylase precursor [compost metagenome]
MPRLVRRVQQEGYQYFDWNVSSTDAAQAVQPKAEIVNAVLSAAAKKPAVIVLMHDARGKTTTVEALPEVIRGLREMGFRFDVLHKDSFAVHFLE